MYRVVYDARLCSSFSVHFIVEAGVGHWRRTSRKITTQSQNLSRTSESIRSWQRFTKFQISDTFWNEQSLVWCLILEIHLENLNWSIHLIFKQNKKHLQFVVCLNVYRGYWDWECIKRVSNVLIQCLMLTGEPRLSPNPR